MNAICLLGIVPVRKQPDDTSEMVTQLIYGEQCYILESIGNWWEIKAKNDDYNGFVDKLQLHLIESLPTYLYITQSPILRFNSMYLPMGSELSDEDLPKAVADNMIATGELALSGVAQGRDQIIQKATSLLKIPYLWGGKSAFGIDCSGLTQIVYKACGYSLPRDSGQQAEVGDPVTITDAKDGDLAFFCKPGKSTISHVGIVKNEEEGTMIIHASGLVRIDQLTHQGIITEDGQCTHELLFIRDIITSVR